MTVALHNGSFCQKGIGENRGKLFWSLSFNDEKKREQVAVSLRHISTAPGRLREENRAAKG